MSIRQGNNLIAGTPDITGKADTDLSNLSSTGKSTVAELPMPSDNYINLTVPASGSSYTAPANGYVSMYALTNGSGAITLDNVGIYQNIGSVVWTPSSQGLSAYVPVRKGQSVRIGYINIAQFLSFKFIYAEGEI